jgi:predicted secreted protein
MTVNFISIFAEYFICWWITLFMVLPIGLRTQADENEVTMGTVKSAPAHFRFWRVFLLTTGVSAVLYAGWFVVTAVYGVNALTISSWFPHFDS